MGTEPLEPKAWDGRWLAIVFKPATETTDAGYMLYEVQRAANHYYAAVLAVANWKFAVGTHLMVIALSGEIEVGTPVVTVDPEVPGPRWYRVYSGYTQQVSEDAWLRETKPQWTRPTPATAAADGQE